MHKAICIIGATAVGKTDLALKLGKLVNGVLISADSAQVFKKLNIISGKDIDLNYKFTPLKKPSDYNLGYYDINGIFMYGLDLIEPTQNFSISDFIKVSRIYLNDIYDQNKLPIIVGGSGLYINSILNPKNTLNIKPDFKLRKQLEEESPDALLGRIKKLDFKFYESLNNSERNNKRRLIRRIEILSSKKPLKEEKIDYEFLVIGLKLNKEKNIELIKKRIKKRIENGAIEEVEDLYKNYDGLSDQVKNIIGYKDLFAYLNEEKSLEAAITDWEKSEIDLIKKQNTWFKKNSEIKWFEAQSQDLFRLVAREVNSFLLS